MPLGTEVDLGPSDIVLDGDLAPPKGHSSQFSAHVCCGQTAGWIKMPLGTEVDLGRPLCYMGAQLQRGTTDPCLFGPCLLWPNGRHLSYC